MKTKFFTGKSGRIYALREHATLGGAPERKVYVVAPKGKRADGWERIGTAYPSTDGSCWLMTGTGVLDARTTLDAAAQAIVDAREALAGFK